MGGNLLIFFKNQVDCYGISQMPIFPCTIPRMFGLVRIQIKEDLKHLIG